MSHLNPYDTAKKRKTRIMRTAFTIRVMRTMRKAFRVDIPTRPPTSESGTTKWIKSTKTSRQVGGLPLE